jgi:hypothetical protein
MWFVFCCKKMMFSAWLKGVFETFQNMYLFLPKRKKILGGADKDGHKVLAKQIKNAEKEAVGSIISRRSQEGKGSLLLQMYCKLFL